MKKPSEIIDEALLENEPNYLPPDFHKDTPDFITSLQTKILDQLHERLLKVEGEEDKESKILEFIKFNKITLDDLNFILELKATYLGQWSGIYRKFRGIDSGDIYLLRDSDFKSITKVFK